MSTPNTEPSVAPARLSRRAACIALVFLVALAAYLRLRGFDALLPYATQSDARAIARQVELIRSDAAHPELDPSWSYYPLLVARIVAILPAADPSKARSLDEHLACASLLWTQIRLVSIVVALLAVPGTYLLARRFLDRTRSLFAAGLVATSLMHGSLSTLEKPHAIVTSFVLLGMLAALRLLRKPTIGSYALCGIAGAAAFGALQSGLMILPAFAAAHALRAREGLRRWRPWIGVIAAIAILAVGWCWLWPARSPHPSHASSGPTLPLGGQGIDFSRFDGSGVVRMVSELWGLDPLLVALSAIGLGVGLIGGLARVWRMNEWRPLAVVLASAGSYALVAGLYGTTAGRYVLPLVPFLACLAAAAIPRRFAAQAGLLLIVPLVPAWKLAELRARPDTFEEAAAFIAERLPRGATAILIPSFDLPLFTDERTTRANASVPWATPWGRYLDELDPAWIQGARHAILVQPPSSTATPRVHVTGNLSYFTEHGARWVIANCEPGPPMLREDIATLRARAELVARFSPLVHDDGRDIWMPPVDPAVWPGPYPRAWRMFEARAYGPTIEVYRLP
jgi:hypothetical protein